MNQLADETSPYLLQHANNPVHWLPWGEAAFRLAREQDKPVLLSIGYSACHWCHVMAHESFEDEATAELMNRLFINIKVDREQRPDLDKIYQQAHSALTRRAGGWPLTVFLNPHDQMPIFAGTYFPPEPSHGLPAFKQLLTHIADTYQQRRNDIERQSASLRDFFHQQGQLQPYADALSALPLDITSALIRQQFDTRDGGFSPAPKFPHPGILGYALYRWHHSARAGKQDEQLLLAALFTLEKMCHGGVFDQLGGGFFRYSTDKHWMIPHFEKMLYDNGPLLALCAQAWHLSGRRLYRDTAKAIAEWVMRDMQSPEGGYYCALDADTGEGEGAFYVWTQQELKQLITKQDWPLLSHYYGFGREANFEGRWHPHVYCDAASLSRQHALSLDTVHERLSRCRDTLFEARSQRPPPACDDKVLSAWNGLMIHAMACAGRLLQQPHYIESAQRAARFVHDTLWRDQRLFACHCRGRSQFNATLDDYAFMLQALLELLQCDWQPRWLQWAQQLADTLLARFEDPHHGGFYFTSDDHETLIQRSKGFADESMPAGNAIATLCLQRLGWLLGETRYLHAAEKTLRAAWNAIDSNPLAHCSMLNALQEFLQPPAMVILRGTPEAVAAWQRIADRHASPDTLVFSCPPLADEPAWLRSKTLTGEACAYICRGHDCQAPITRLTDFARWLRSRAHKTAPQTP